ncbi:DUF4192 domain-containing protein [Rhizomonospora bruguierae]|uniref:DUF4192 domain-containing protein n=1 Tax=Rhizomonospora bruguierae TaxID=1581705 RepID=UPI001BD06273|nr:DUF4192 domain-containing protein [Micromonospora sp. NBRC 107566]
MNSFPPLDSDSRAAGGAPLAGPQPAAAGPERAALAVRAPADLLAAVPYLLGFHPERSLVVTGLHGSRLTFTARVDLPPAGTPTRAVRAQARHAVAVVARQRVEAALLIGYGTAEEVVPLMEAVRSGLVERSIAVEEELRVAGDRYWSLLCSNPACCPPQGRPFDPSGTVVAATATLAGEVALPDRAALAAQIAPLTGAARAAADRATERADERLSALLAAARPADLLGGRALRVAGMAAVEEAIARQRAGRPLSDDDIAWLTVVLLHPPVRDHAWVATTGEGWAVELWSEVLRRAVEDLVPAPASLLSFAAWHAGRGPLAGVALERALRVDPTYPLARFMADVLCAGVPPELLDDLPRPATQTTP